MTGHSKVAEITGDEVKEESESHIKRCENSTVFPSLPLAIKWLRDNSQRNQSVRYQVMWPRLAILNYYLLSSERCSI